MAAVSFSIGSSGRGEESYWILIPFNLSPGRTIELNGVHRRNLSDGLAVSIEPHGQSYYLKIGAFSSEKVAEEYFQKLICAIKWVSLKNKMGIEFPEKITPVELYQNPQPISPDCGFYSMFSENGWNYTDGNYDNNVSVIIPEHKRLLRFGVGNISVIVGLKSESLIEDLDKCIKSEVYKPIQANSKLSLALELYSSHHFESSIAVKFINLVTVIESLLPDTEISGHAVDIIVDRSIHLAEAEISRMKEISDHEDQIEQIKHLIERIRGLKKQTIRKKYLNFLGDYTDLLPGLGDKKAALRVLDKIYATRSDLLHDGIYDAAKLQQGIEILSILVPGILNRLCSGVVISSNNTLQGETQAGDK